MISRGEVKSVRELSGGRVQAQVCLGSDVRLGSAVMMYEASSPAVQEAMRVLKEAISAEAIELTANIVEEHAKWQAERDAAREARLEQERKDATARRRRDRAAARRVLAKS